MALVLITWSRSLEVSKVGTYTLYTYMEGGIEAFIHGSVFF